MEEAQRYGVHDLASVCDSLLEAVGTPKPEAEMVRDSLIEANLAGHDSHGVLLLAGYLDGARKGSTKVGAAVEVEDETAVSARLNGNWNFGQVVARKALDVGMEKASRQGIALITSRQTNHVGRLGQYTLMAAEAGYIGIMMVNTGPAVAPWGGYGRRLGTNPISIASPRKGARPVVLDMATSVVAAGKVFLKSGTGQRTPDGWFLNKSGRPSTDPDEYNDGGAMLSAGTYKGYGLALMVDILCGALTGTGTADRISWTNGIFLLVLRPNLFVPESQFLESVTGLADFVKASPVREGFEGVLLPGDPEYTAMAERREKGIPVSGASINRLKKAAEELGVPFKLAPLAS